MMKYSAHESAEASYHSASYSMRLVISLIGVLCLIDTINAQSSIYETGGNVGIGGAPSAGSKLTVISGSNDPTLLRLEAPGPAAGYYVNFADVSIHGQGYGSAFLRWTRDNNLGRSFSVHTSDSGGNSAERFFVGSDGRIGIGTPVPSFLLDVYGGGIVSDTPSGAPWGMGIRTDSLWGGWARQYSFFSTNGTQFAAFCAMGNGDNLDRVFFGTGLNSAGASGAEWLTIRPSGAVGIGTADPGTGTTMIGEKFDVENGYMRLGCSNGPFFNFYQPNAGADLKFMRIGMVSGDMYFDSINDGYTSPRTRIFVQNTTGNVGIGTISPTQKLSVNGAVRAKEVIVETTGWSDYVLSKEYQLQSLASVGQYIEDHQTLPGIPSAREIAEKGVSVGEMQAKLLAKVEELTLHLIAQQKQLDAQAREIVTLREQLKRE
jgi:hypothetical protein